MLKLLFLNQIAMYDTLLRKTLSMGTSGTNQENPRGSSKLDYLEKAPQPKLTPSTAPQRLRAVFFTVSAHEWKVTRAGRSCWPKPVPVHCVQGFGSNCPTREIHKALWSFLVGKTTRSVEGSHLDMAISRAGLIQPTLYPGGGCISSPC